MYARSNKGSTQYTQTDSTIVINSENIYMPDITSDGGKFEYLVGLDPNGRLFPQPLASGYDSIQKAIGESHTPYSTWVRDTTAGRLSPANSTDTVYIPEVLKLGSDLYAPEIGFQLVPSTEMDVLVKNQSTGLIHTYPLEQFTNTVDTSGHSLFAPNNTTVELNVSYDTLKIAYVLIDRAGWGLIERDISTLFSGQDNYIVGNITVRSDSLRNSFVARPDFYVDDTLKGNALVSIGQYSSYWNKGGDNRVNIGTFAGGYAKGNSHVSVGYSAGNNSDGNILVNIGDNAGSHNTGDWFIGIGDKAGENNSGDVVETFGYDCARNNSGDWVTFIGYDAGAYNSGSRCYGFGQYALTRNTGDTCIGIGRFAGAGNKASNNIFLGFFPMDTSYHCVDPYVNIIGDWKANYSTIDTGTTYIGGNLKLFKPHTLSADRGSYLYFNDNTSLRGVSSKVYAMNFVADTSIQITGKASAPTTSNGKIYFNSSDKNFYGYGDEWVMVSPPGKYYGFWNADTTSSPWMVINALDNSNYKTFKWLNIVTGWDYSQTGGFATPSDTSIIIPIGGTYEVTITIGAIATTSANGTIRAYKNNTTISCEALARYNITNPLSNININFIEDYAANDFITLKTKLFSVASSNVYTGSTQILIKRIK